MQIKILSLLLFVGLTVVAAAPIEDDDQPVVITENIFPEELSIYKAKHDIVNLVVPSNSINFGDDEKEDDSDEYNIYIFFVEADIKPNGEKDYKGLYVLRNGKAKKILDNGRDAAASNDDSKLVFFGAQDGIYVFDESEQSAKKYGTLTDSIIAIAKENGTDLIYILTEDHHVYKVSDEGKVKTKINEIKDAQQIVLDAANNLYYYDSNKNVYVYDSKTVKKIEGLPASKSYFNIVKPPLIFEDGIPVIVDNQSYFAYSNGTSENTKFELQVHPSAYAMEATLIQYFAYDKQIYEYNLLALVISELLDDLKKFLDDEKDAIKEIGTRSRKPLPKN